MFRGFPNGRDFVALRSFFISDGDVGDLVTFANPVTFVSFHFVRFVSGMITLTT